MDVRHSGAESSGIRLSELIGALSMAIDLGMGQPLEYGLASCVLAMRLGEAAGFSSADLRAAYFLSLLRYVGCNAGTYEMAALFGDELELRAEFAQIDPGQASQVMRLSLRYLREANAGASPLRLAQVFINEFLSLPRIMREQFTGHCEVAQRLAERMGLDDSIILALGQLYERWDGKGMPHGLKGEAVAPTVRLVTLAQDAVIFHRMGGSEAAVTMARQRSGGAYDPALVALFCAHAETLLADLDGDTPWQEVIELEPGPRHTLIEAELDAACQAIADFVDIKSPFLLGHSSGVAELAAAAAARGDLPANDQTLVRRAGWLHDLGQVGVSAGIWGKSEPLSERDWEAVRLHAYQAERVLARPGALAAVGAVAGRHHERQDGSGYHRGVPGSQLSPTARILAAADVYHALAEPRPHRPAYSADQAADMLGNEARNGRLDSDTVAWVLGAAGQPFSRTKATLPSGLTEREAEVLRLVARGRTVPQVADQLVVSRKTADNHVQHIYGKIGVSTRAGATLFAMEHALL
jgi:HD-GYP domain-containing protein (c-di-GMP phosphodiesterase class II)